MIIGIIARFENWLKREVHWSVCLLHFNELPLRRLFKHIDGDTQGPRGFKGDIGKRLANNDSIPIVKFKPIQSKYMPVISNDVINDLSNDQKYLYNIVSAVQKGICSKRLESSQPGPLNHARFLTLACRILRDYMTHTTPSVDIKILAEYIVEVYAPFWFLVKCHPHFYEGPRHFFKLIEMISHLRNDIKTIIQTVVQDNAYFAHKENVLVAMLVDSDKAIRQKAVNLIMSSRQLQLNSIRTFEKPHINFDASDYTEMVDMNDEDGIEPPITKNLSIDQIVECTKTPQNIVFNMLYGIPCHTQSVERAIRLLSERAQNVFTEENRNRSIYNKIECTKILPKTNTKADYIEFVNK